MEQLGAPVRLTLGEYTNLKVTTPDDMVVAGQILTKDSCRRKAPKPRLTPPWKLGLSR